MPLIRIDIVKGKSPEYKKTLLDCVHEGLVEALGIEDWDRFQRIVEIDREDFEFPEGKTDAFMIIEITMFPGRTAEQKKAVIERVTARITEKLGIPATDVLIVLHEPADESWGFAGRQKGVKCMKNEGIDAPRVAQDDRYVIREMRPDERPLLMDFLYEAIFIPEGVEPPARDIVELPELRVYTDGFGSGTRDYCLVADLDGQPVGAVWSRIMNDYGHLDDDTPSLAIALYKPHRGRGLGTQLMLRMLSLLSERGCRTASLAVQKANYAVKMYEKVGFKTVEDRDEEWLMRWEEK